jgi:hypothetical protein
MSKYPVEVSDNEGVIDAINYLLSGPSGLGQFFKGFSSYTDAYLTGNFRLPYSQVTPAAMYVAPINCSSAEQLDDRTFKYNFSVAQPSPPFALGNNIRGQGWTNGFYNGGVGTIGVAECTTTYVIFRTGFSYPGIGDDLAGGQVYWNAAGEGLMSTDCNARVIVSGATDRVFISAQINNLISYITTISSNLTYTVSVDRYYAERNNDPINPEFVFSFDKTISQKTYNLTGITGTGSLPEIETIFTTVIDDPEPRFYWYILQVLFVDPGAGSVLTFDNTTLVGGTNYTAGTYPTTTDGYGEGLTVDITVNGTNNVITVAVNDPGAGYAVGDTITITDGDDNATIEVLTVNDGLIVTECKVNLRSLSAQVVKE